MGFLSNRKDEALLKRRAHRRVLVQAIRDAIQRHPNPGLAHLFSAPD
jgi:N-acetylmuramoyl-L-alanine amidase